MKPHVRMVITLSSFVFLVMMGYSLISPILPLYGLKFGASVVMVSMLVAAFAIARMVLDMPAGLLGSRYHPKSLMLFGLALISSSSIVCALAPNYWVLLVGRIIEGAGSAFYTTMSTTLLALSVPPESRGKYMSIFTAMLLLGGITGPGVGGLVAAAWGIRAPFYFYALVTGIGFVLVLYIVDQSAVEVSEEEISLRDITRLLREPSFILVNLATFSLFFTRAGVTATLVPLFAYKNLHMTAAMLGGILTMTAFATFVTMTPSGTFTDKHGRRPSMMACLALTGILTMLIPFTTGYYTFVLVMIGYGLTLGLSGPMAAWITDITPRKRLPAGMGLFRTVNDAGFVLGPLVLGATAQLTMTGGSIGNIPFIIAGMFLFIMTLTLVRTRDPVTESKKRVGGKRGEMEIGKEKGEKKQRKKGGRDGKDVTVKNLSHPVIEQQ